MFAPTTGGLVAVHGIACRVALCPLDARDYVQHARLPRAKIREDEHTREQECTRRQMCGCCWKDKITREVKSG